MSTCKLFIKFVVVTKPARTRFAVTADIPHSARTSAFIINSLVSRNFSICFQRIAALSIGSSLTSSLVLITSTSDTLLDTMDCEDCTPSHAQAIKMRKFSQEGRLTDDVILSIMEAEKPNQREQFRMPKDRIAKYFPAGTPAQKIEDTIVKALELYRKRQRDMER